jgi:hypothetical protein
MTAGSGSMLISEVPVAVTPAIVECPDCGGLAADSSCDSALVAGGQLLFMVARRSLGP